MSEKVSMAIKWSFLTELVVKIISPITNMILARILIPSDFGVIATLTMITTFADMFTDSGFQKYIIQHKFDDDNEKSKYISVAFWTNLIISVFFCLFIIIFSGALASFLGIYEHKNAIQVYSIILILTSFSSIQYGIYKKNLEYKKLGIIRIFTKISPLLVTIPLALLKFGYWSLVIGNIFSELITALFLMLWTNQKIKFYYNFQYLKNMFNFCAPALLEVLSSWMVANVAVFIIGQNLGNYYLGIYKTSITTVNQIVSIITASTISIIFSKLSEEQFDDRKFIKTLYSFQRKIGIFTIPLGFCIWMYRDFLTYILLGNGWIEASYLIGLWGFIMCESVIFADLCSIAIISKGKPIYVFISNMIQVILLCIILNLYKEFSFNSVVLVLSIIRVQLILTHTIFSKFVSELKIIIMISNIKYILFASLIMFILSSIFNTIFTNVILEGIFGGFFSIIIYFSVLLFFKDFRKDVYSLFKTVKE